MALPASNLENGFVERHRSWFLSLPVLLILLFYTLETVLPTPAANILRRFFDAL